MKLIHLSDLHIGKRMNEFSMLEDQRYILDQITSIIEKEAPDAVLICGDIYDKPVPPSDAVRVLDGFLTSLAQKKVPVFLISGNHDSAERLAFGSQKIIAEGRVKVNGHPVKVGDKMDPNRDVLHVDDERIYIQKNQQLYYLALYKPRGYVTTASDELGRKTVMDLVSDIPARLYPVGRLDKDSEGLLLMTNDGAFAQAVTHPSGGISKLYRVTVQPRADEATILKLSSGVVLDDGTKTMPCAINVVTDEPGRTVMEMTLKEGKNREIRRMCESVGLEVVRLKRNAEGVVKLGMLKPGTYRELTKAEVNGLRAAAVKGRAQTRSAAQQSKAAERRPRGPVGKNAPRKQK